MGKFHATIRTKFGEVRVEADSRKEMLDLVKEAIALIDDIKVLIPEEAAGPMPAPPVRAPIAKKELEDIIEVTANGRPHIVVPPAKLTAKDVIGLMLYWRHPEGLSMNELTDLVSLNWKAVDQPYVAATIGDLKGQVLKEGPRGKYIYKLSGTGRSHVETVLLPKLKGKSE